MSDRQDLKVVITELSDFIQKEFDVPEDDNEFNDDVHLFDYGYVDSFGAAKLGLFVTDKWGVEITDADLVVHSLNTIREIATLVHQRL